MLEAIQERAGHHHLDIFGTLSARPSDGVGEGTIILLGPREPGFWASLTSSPEWRDQAPDPVDRWSLRVISEIAQRAGGTPLFPFGETLHPFMSWAIRSGRAWSSPVHLLVHDVAGLMVSFRGAILMPEQIPPDSPRRSPCEACDDKPCLRACPVDALTADGYDTGACHTFLDTEPGQACMDLGCKVRRSCPISVTYGRMAAQSAFHMERFHR